MIFSEKYKNTRMITWSIINQCNFHCSYCFIHDKHIEPIIPIDIHKLKENLSLLQKEWVFYITGGEPFLEKKIVEICKIITQKHYVSLNTNLSLKEVFHFADEINPERVLSISAAVHINEREKRDKNLRSYIEKICYLQKKGFNIIVSYVVSPDLLGRVKDDMEHLRASGVEKVRMKVFRGIYKGKFYPDAFNNEEREFLKTIEFDYPELDILLKKHNYRGKQCRAGKDFFIMDRNGNLKRCSNTFRTYGNFFESSMNRDAVIRPCPVKKCGCPYEGIRNVMNSNSSYNALIREEVNHKYQESKHIMMKILHNPKSIKKVSGKVVEYFARQN
jgi:MoaA/NifB/PqqE/SkfB family radical SAM enzyme